MSTIHMVGTILQTTYSRRCASLCGASLLTSPVSERAQRKRTAKKRRRTTDIGVVVAASSRHVQRTLLHRLAALKRKSAHFSMSRLPPAAALASKGVLNIIDAQTSPTPSAPQRKPDLDASVVGRRRPVFAAVVTQFEAILAERARPGNSAPTWRQAARGGALDALRFPPSCTPRGGEPVRSSGTTRGEAERPGARADRMRGATSGLQTDSTA